MLRVYIKTPGGGAWVEYTPVLRPDRNFEIGGMALNGQADQGTITVDDPDYTLEEQTDTAGHREVKITEDDSGSEVVLALGRIGPKSMERGAHPQGRELTLTVEDVNAELRGIVVDKWDRPSETGRARVVELVAAYLDGPSSTELIPGTGPFAGDQWGRNSTTLDITGTHVPSINNVLMPAKRYDATDPLSVLRECAEWEGKNVHVFVADDGSKKLVYLPTNDTATNECDFEISDNPSQVDDDTIFAPWWIAGPALNIDPLETVTGINLIHPDGARSFERSPTDEANFDRWEESMYSEADSGFSTELAALLLARSRETRRRQFAIRLPGSKVHQIKPGMLLHVIRARAADIPNVNTTGSMYRIAQIRYQWHGPDAEDDNAYLVLVTLEATIKTARRWGTRPPIRPPSPGSGDPPEFVDGAVAFENDDLLDVGYDVVGGADHALYVAVLSQPTTSTVRWYPSGPTFAYESFTKLGELVDVVNAGVTQRFSIWRLLAPSAAVANNTVRAIQLGDEAGMIGVMEFSGVNQADSEGTLITDQGVGSSSAVSVPVTSNQLAINFAGWMLQNASGIVDPTEGGGQTEGFVMSQNNSPGRADVAMGGGYDSSAPTWAFATSRDWVAAGLAVNGTGSVGDHTEPVGDTGGGTTGSGGTYAPINHVHEHGDLSEDEDHQHDLSDLQNDTANGLDLNAQVAFDQQLPVGSTSDPTVDDDAYLVGTVWVNTSTGDMFIITDHSAGAAVWEPLNATPAADFEVPFDHGSMGATETIAVGDGKWHRGVLSANCTITVSGFTVDEGVILLVGLTQDGTGGWDLTWDSDVIWGSDDQPAQAAADVTWFLLWSDEGDSVIYGSKVGGASTSVALHASTHESGGSDEIDVTGLTGAGSGGGPTIQRTVVSRQGNITTTSATFVVVDNTKLPAISVASCATGDLIELELTAQSYNSGGNVGFLDWEVVQPTAGTRRVSTVPNDGGIATIGAGTARNVTFTRAVWICAEAGTHTFQPFWRCTAGTQTMANAASGSDDTIILHTVTRWPAALVL